MSPTSKGKGGRTKEEKPEDPKVFELTPNRTVLVLPVSPKKANQISDTGELEKKQVSGLEDVVRSFEPEMDFQLKEIKNVGNVQEKEKLELKEAVMHYGKEDPQTVVDDFTESGLVGKIKKTEVREEDTEIDASILLKQRLDSLALEHILSRLAERDFADSVANNRENMVKAIEEEIARIEKVITRLRSPFEDA